MAAANPSTASLLADFVSSALSAHLQHDDRAYDTLLAQLTASVKASDSAAVCRWLNALAGCSSTIAAASHSAFRGLLAILLDAIALPSLTADSLPAYCGFLVDFATAAHTQRGAAEVALRKLVDALHYAPPDDRTDTSAHTRDESDTHRADRSTQPAQPQQLYMAAHAALKRSHKCTQTLSPRGTCTAHSMSLHLARLVSRPCCVV